MGQGHVRNASVGEHDRNLVPEVVCERAEFRPTPFVRGGHPDRRPIQSPPSAPSSSKKVSLVTDGDASSPSNSPAARCFVSSLSYSAISTLS